MSDDPDWEKAKDGCYYHAWYRHLGYDPDDKYTVHCEYKPKINDTPPGALDKAADAMGEWNQEKADAKIREMAREIQKDIDAVAFGKPQRCDLCGYEYDPLGRWTVKWDGEQWICGRCERNTESKVTVPKRCTCGQAKSGGGGFHSDWCDLVTGG